MDRRDFLCGAGAGLLLALLPQEAGAVEVHLKELIALTKAQPKESMASVTKTAAEASKLGWTCPVKGGQMRWLGAWNLTTHKGKKAKLTMVKGGGIRYDGGAKPWFTGWKAMSGSGKPMFMVLTDGKKEVWFQYYQRPGVVFLSNYANRKQFMTFTMRS